MADENLPPNNIVYRAIKKAGWVVEGVPQPDIFLRRVLEPELSLITEINCSENYCSNIIFNKCYGEISIRVESFVKRGFKVKHTPLPADPEKGFPPVPHHASVYGMPPEDEAEARNIAFDLLDEYITLTPRKYKSKR